MAKARISVIAAIGKNRELGKDNKLLWHIPEDLKRFKELTRGHAVIMGRKTFESIGRPLPNRMNIIITRDKNYFNVLKHYNNVIICNSLENAIKLAKQSNIHHPSSIINEVFIIGGGQIYAQAISYADKLYLTIVEGVYDADTFFPDYSSFKKLIKKETKESEGYTYTFLDLEK